MNLTRKIFWVFNKLFMVPLFRLGLAPLIGNPITGYIMLIKVIGRKSSKLRYTPVNYAIINGFVYCLAGFGRKSHWYLNILANPRFELVMPGGAFTAEAQELNDPDEALTATKPFIKTTIEGMGHGRENSRQQKGH